MRFIILICGFLMSVPTAWSQDKVVVLELLSSQGCSDSPPAEAAYLDLIEQYNDQIIAFNCHTTFFDKGSWADPYSHILCDQRYQDYNNSGIFFKSGVPQTILNGKFSTGKPQRPILNAMTKMGFIESKVLKADLQINENTLELGLPQIKTSNPLVIWLIGYQDFQETFITAGLNEGGLLKQGNLVRYIKKIGLWDGNSLSQSLPIPSNEDDLKIDGYIVLAQERFDPLSLNTSMDILAAGHARKVLQSKIR